MQIVFLGFGFALFAFLFGDAIVGRALCTPLVLDAAFKLHLTGNWTPPPSQKKKKKKLFLYGCTANKIKTTGCFAVQAPTIAVEKWDVLAARLKSQNFGKGSSSVLRNSTCGDSHAPLKRFFLFAWETVKPGCRKLVCYNETMDIDWASLACWRDVLYTMQVISQMF